VSIAVFIMIRAISIARLHFYVAQCCFHISLTLCCSPTQYIRPNLTTVVDFTHRSGHCKVIRLNLCATLFYPPLPSAVWHSEKTRNMWYTYYHDSRPI